MGAAVAGAAVEHLVLLETWFRGRREQSECLQTSPVTALSMPTLVCLTVSYSKMFFSTSSEFLHLGLFYCPRFYLEYMYLGKKKRKEQKNFQINVTYPSRFSSNTAFPSLLRSWLPRFEFPQHTAWQHRPLILSYLPVSASVAGLWALWPYRSWPVHPHIQTGACTVPYLEQASMCASEGINN